MKISKLIFLIIAVQFYASSFAQKLETTDTITEELRFKNFNSKVNTIKVNNIKGAIKVIGHYENTVKIKCEKKIIGKNKVQLETGKKEVRVEILYDDSYIHLYVESPISRFDKDTKKIEEIPDVKYNYDFEVDMTIWIPISTNLKLKAVHLGDINVSNINGEIEAENVKNSIVMNHIRGPVIAKTLEKDIIIRFDKVKNNSHMAFSTLTGNTDITLPKDTEATINVKSVLENSIYTDFKEMNISNRKAKTNSNNSINTKYKLVYTNSSIFRPKSGFKISLNKNNSKKNKFLIRNLNGKIIIRSKK